MNRLNSLNVLPRVELKVHFKNGHRGRRRLTKEENQSHSDDKYQNLPRLTKLLALAHRWNRLIEEGIVANYSEIARLMGLSRARVTQIMDLLYLAPDIQEEILLPPSEGWQIPDVSERAMRKITQIQNWSEQRDLRRRARIARSHVSP